jgi:hypothetical protein
MKQFEDFKKQIPYSESQDYLKHLIEQSTEKAISQGRKPKAKVLSLRLVVTAAAALALLLVVGITQFRDQSDSLADVQYVEDTLALAADSHLLADASNGPIDDFLNSLTDDEAQLLTSFEIEEIPEY